MNVLLAQVGADGEGTDTRETAASVEKGLDQTLDMIKNFEFAELLDIVLKWLIAKGPTILFALIFLVIGMKIAGAIGKAAKKTLAKAKVEESLGDFLGNVFGFILKIFVLIITAHILGIPMTSFIAILGAAGLAVGLALKDGLANFAGGVVLLLFKPIKVGDLITVAGHHGFVKSISIFYTVLETRNNHNVTIPNGTVSNSDVVNLSASPLVRVQALVGIGYGDDVKKARELMLAQTLKDERIARDPEPFVVLKELGDNSVNMELRCWAEPRPYRRVLFELLENIKEAFDANGISIPYPQRDLHIINDSVAPAPSEPILVERPVAQPSAQGQLTPPSSGS